ncbi:MAG: MFS transporter [Actinomycetota bacterium]|nr:MFS transporter [Actinomycetota bacterium]
MAETATPVTSREPSRLRRAWQSAAGPFLVDGPLRLLYVSALIDAVGLGTYTTCSAVYFKQGIGLSNAEVGLALTAAAGASLLGILPVGWISDRMGARRALMMLYLWRAIAFIALATAHNLLTASIAAGAAGILSRSMSPVTQALALDLATGAQRRIQALAAMRALRNGGFALGAIPSAIAVATHGYRPMLLSAVALFLFAAAISYRMPSTTKPARNAVDRRGASRDRRFLALTVANAAVGLQTVLFVIGLPLWLVERTDAPRWLVSFMAVTNTVLILALQVRASRGAERTVTARRLIIVAGLVSAGACLLPPVASHVGGLAAALVMAADVALFTLAQLWLSGGGWGLAVAYSPEEGRAGYLAVFNLGLAAVTILGPALVTAIVAAGTLGWLVAAGYFVLAGFAARLLPAIDEPALA